MKFYLLAVCGILCALSSMSHARKEVEVLGRSEVPDIKCPFGSATVTVWSSCLRGTKNSRDCKHVTVKCLALRGFWTDTNPKVSGSVPPPKTVGELDDETVPKECPLAHQPVNVSPFCPSDAQVTSNCPPSNMIACVPEPFGNKPGSLSVLDQEWGMERPLRTRAELDFEMAHKSCIFGQRPAKISPWCRTAANEVVDCQHTEVWCVQETFTSALKTVEEVEREILDMICPPKHRPTLIRRLCPIGSKRKTDCDEYRKACRPEAEEVIPAETRNSLKMSNPWNGIPHPEHWSKAGQGRPGGRPWRIVNNINNGFRIRP